MSASDEEIATVVQAGDSELFGELISRYEDKLKRYARRFLAREEEVEDLVQDVFIKAYTNIQSFNTQLRFSPWIYRVAHNTFVNELKRKERYGTTIFDADAMFAFLPAREKADTNTLADDDKNMISESLSTLSPKLREVLVLHYFEDLSYKEIADVLQIPVTTVGVRITRARNKLQQVLNNKKL
ncbi:MAG: RNA polymerase sigma factor [Candidatus Paceibacteria bacterium]